MTLQQWAAFDVTVHRLLTAMLGEHGISVPKEHTALRALIDQYPQPLTGPVRMPRSESQPTTRDHFERQAAASTRRQHLLSVPSPAPDEPPALDVEGLPQITDPHPMARLTCAFGALADLLHRHRVLDRIPDDIDGLTDASRRVLAIAALAAHHTMASVPLANTQRPMTVGLHAEGFLDSLTTGRPAVARWLYEVAATHAQTAPSSPRRSLDVVVAEWARTSETEVHAAVPSVDSLRTLTRQGTHLLATIEELACAGDTRSWAGEDPTGLREAVTALIDVDQAWPSGASTLTRPAHTFVDASRALHEALEPLRLGAARLDGADRDTAMAALLRATSHLSHQLISGRTLPERLACSGLLFAPARSLTPAPDRLSDRKHGRHIPATLNDISDLMHTWHEAVDRFLQANVALMHPSQVRQMSSSDMGPSL
ncbi:hypothetical protein [Phycicoccus sp. Soil803]|uniref:hypothetical protein n=1 Tax=Phycicoccus sp. Soil803 TaxID=1736415 RepID=UPI0012FB6417|nr:hypothetical protein [Phycicoccus sp. Soil803]